MKKTQSKASLKHIPSNDQISKSKDLKSRNKLGQIKLQSKVVQTKPHKQLKNNQKQFEKQQRYLIECNKCRQFVDRDVLNQHLKICNQQKQQASIFSQLDQCQYCKRLLPKLMKVIINLSEDSHLKKCSQIAKSVLNQKKSKLKTINSENKLGLLKIKKKSKTKQIIEPILDRQSKQKYKKKNRSKSKLFKSKLASSKQKVEKRRSQSKKLKVRDNKQSLRNSSSLKFESLRKSKEKKPGLENKKIIERNIQTSRQNISNNRQNSNTMRSNNAYSNRRMQERQNSAPRVAFLQNFSQFNLTGTLDQQLQALSNNFTNLIETVSTMVNSPLINNRRVLLFQQNNFSQDTYTENVFQAQTVSEQNGGGLRTQQIQTIPVHIFNRTRNLSSIDQSTKSCPVCLLQFKNGDPLKTLYCAHTFHQQCIDKWLEMKSSCPICRDNLK